MHKRYPPKLGYQQLRSCERNSSNAVTRVNTDRSSPFFSPPLRSSAYYYIPWPSHGLIMMLSISSPRKDLELWNPSPGGSLPFSILIGFRSSVRKKSWTWSWSTEANIHGRCIYHSRQGFPCRSSPPSPACLPASFRHQSVDQWWLVLYKIGVANCSRWVILPVNIACTVLF